MKLGIEELSIIVEGLRLRVKQLSSSVTEINQSIENLETEDGQKAPAIMQTTNPAAIASFSDGGEDMPVKSLKCTIVAVQSGTGDPSPDNIRPITGRNGVTVTRTGTDPADTVSKSVNFPQTIYGGWVDVVKGELHITHAGVDMGSLTWYNTQSNGFFYAQPAGIKPVVEPPYTNRQVGAIISMYSPDTQISVAFDSMNDKKWLRTGIRIYVKDTAYTNVAAFKPAVTGQTIVYELAEEQIIHLDPVTITTLLGYNNIYCDTGTAEVEYAADTKMYIDNAVAAVTPEPEPEPSPEQDDASPEEEEEEEAEPAPEEDTSEPEEVEEEEAAEEEEAVPVAKKSTRKK